MGGKK
ncbi:unnamed protein product, partial [Didymodactylos carnosus]